MSAVVTITERRCPRCEETKHVSQFGKLKTDLHGYQVYCNQCRREWNFKRCGTKKVAEKQCTACKSYLPASAFHKSTTTSDALGSQCKECVRWYQVFKAYGITKAEYEKKFFDQDGKCAICAKPSMRYLHVDHDHNTNAVRGLLCSNCNTALGLLDDDHGTLKKAVLYLEKYKT
jgi:hypothetical protein